MYNKTIFKKCLFRFLKTDSQIIIVSMKIKHYLDFNRQFPYIFLRIMLSLEFHIRC
jgi:hypothetical protein